MRQSDGFGDDRRAGGPAIRGTATGDVGCGALLQQFIDLVASLGILGTGFVLLVTFAAGVLRGYAGFGFALAAAPALSLILAPADMVPAVTVIALFGGLRLVVKVRHAADWPSTWLLLAGAVVGLPFGIAMLRHLPADLMRALIGIVVLGSVLLLWRGFAISHAPSRAMRLGLGVISGLLNGSTSMGGPPVIIFFLASPAGAAAGRASLIIYFFFLSIVTLALAAFGGLLDLESPLSQPADAAGHVARQRDGRPDVRQIERERLSPRGARHTGRGRAPGGRAGGLWLGGRNLKFRSSQAGAA